MKKIIFFLMLIFLSSFVSASVTQTESCLINFADTSDYIFADNFNGTSGVTTILGWSGGGTGFSYSTDYFNTAPTGVKSSALVGMYTNITINDSSIILQTGENITIEWMYYDDGLSGSNEDRYVQVWSSDSATGNYGAWGIHTQTSSGYYVYTDSSRHITSIARSVGEHLMKVVVSKDKKMAYIDGVLAYTDTQTFATLGSIRIASATDTGTDYYDDVAVYYGTDCLLISTPPVVQNLSSVLLLGSVFNITVNVTDDFEVSSVIVEIEEPDTTKTNYTMSLLTGDIFNKTYISHQIGVHNIIIYGIDNSGNTNEINFICTDDNVCNTDDDLILHYKFDESGTHFVSETGVCGLTATGLGATQQTALINWSTYAITFDGDGHLGNDSSECYSALGNSNEFTLMGVADFTDDNKINTLYNSMLDVVNGVRLRYDARAGVNYLIMLFRDNSVQTTCTFGNYNPAGLNDAFWTIKKTSTDVTLYIDGVQQGQCSGAFAYGVPTSELQIGGSVNAGDDFTGDMDDIILIDRALTDTQILSIYNSGVFFDVIDNAQGSFVVTDLFLPVVEGFSSTLLSDTTFSIMTNITSVNGISSVIVQINEPDNTKTNYTMSLLSGDTFNKTYIADQTGNHNFIIYVIDIYDNLNEIITTVSTDRNDYILSDGIDGDIGFNGVTPSNGDSMTTTGWTISNHDAGGSSTYQNSVVDKGNVSAYVISPVTGGEYVRFDVDDSEFKGRLTVRAKSNKASPLYTIFRIYTMTGQQANFYSASETQWKQTTPSASYCSSGSATIGLDWHNYTWDFTTDNMLVYFDGRLCWNNTGLSSQGLDYFELVSRGADGYYIDQVKVTEGEDPLTSNAQGSFDVPDFIPAVVEGVSSDLLSGSTYDIRANVTDDVEVSSVIVEIEEPDTIKTNYSMSLVSDDTFNKLYIADQVGIHNIVVYGIDSSGNGNSGVSLGQVLLDTPVIDVEEGNNYGVSGWYMTVASSAWTTFTPSKTAPIFNLSIKLGSGRDPVHWGYYTGENTLTIRDSTGTQILSTSTMTNGCNYNYPMQVWYKWIMDGSYVFEEGTEYRIYTTGCVRPNGDQSITWRTRSPDVGETVVGTYTKSNAQGAFKSEGIYEIANLALFSFDAPDITPPVVENLNSILLSGTIYNITADITDDVAVSSVILEIEEPDTTKTNYSMIGNYHYEYTADQVGLHNFKIYAIDSSSNSNGGSNLVCADGEICTNDEDFILNYNMDESGTHFVSQTGICGMTYTGDMQQRPAIFDGSTYSAGFDGGSVDSLGNLSSECASIVSSVSNEKGYTFLSWMSFRDDDTWGYIFDSKYSYGWGIRYYGVTDTVQFSSRDNGGTYHDCNFGYDTQNKKEVFFVVGINSSHATLLVNNTQVGQCAGSFDSGLNTEAVRIGNNLARNTNYGIDADMDEVMLINKTLTSTQMQSIYESGLSEFSNNAESSFDALDVNEPVINSITTINTLGDGVTFDITVNATDNVAVSSVIIEIENPSLIKTNYTMDYLSGDNYNYTFVSDEYGEHNMIVYVIDSSANNNNGYNQGNGISNATLIDSIKAVYKFDNTAQLVDSVTGTYTSTSNDVTNKIAEGTDGTGWGFVNNIVSLPISLVHGEEILGWKCDVKLTTQGADPAIIYAERLTPDIKQFRQLADSSTLIYSQLYTTGGLVVDTYTIPSIVYGEWWTTGWTTDGAVRYGYLDDTFMSSISQTGTIDLTDGTFALGGSARLSINRLVGTLDECYFYTRNLTQEDYTAFQTKYYPFYDTYENGAEDSFTSFDNVVPDINTLVNNDSEVKVGDVITLSADIDELNNDHYKFFWNATGSDVYEVAQSYTDGETVVTQKSITISEAHAYICWGYWANDTEENVNTVSDCFQVENSIPVTAIVTLPIDGLSYVNTGIEFYSSDIDGDDLIYKVYIDSVLNQSVSDNITDFLASDGTYDLYVIVNDGYDDSLNSDIITFTLDTIAPIITVTSIHMTYNETYNSLPVYINFTTDENAICILDNNNWSVIQTGGTSHSFEDTNETPEQFYEIMISCNDTLLNTRNQMIYFSVDRTPPFANYNNPSKYGDTSIYTFGTFNLSVDAWDNLAMYLYNANITKVSDNTLMWSYKNNTISNQSINISHFYLRESLDVSSWENTTYRFDDYECDAHTANKLKEKDKPKNIKKGVSKIEYEFGSDVDISIEGISGYEDGTDNIESFDRNKPKFKYKKNKGNYPDKKIFKLKSNKKIQRISNDAYAGWFVIDDRYWVDFEDGEGSKVDVEEGIDEWLITLHNPSEEIIFDSIGVLNCKSESFLFEFKQPYAPVIIPYSPSQSSDGALGQTVLFNIEASDNNSEDTITYEWFVDNVSYSSSEDIEYLFSTGYIGKIYNLEVVVSDDSPFVYSDTYSWIVSITSGHYTEYVTEDFDEIVVDGIGTAGASFIDNIEIIIMSIVLLIGAVFLGIIIKKFK